MKTANKRLVAALQLCSAALYLYQLSGLNCFTVGKEPKYLNTFSFRVKLIKKQSFLKHNQL